MATIPQELDTILQTYVKPNYANAVVDNYYDATTLTVKAPTTNPDRGMQALTEMIISERSPLVYGYNIALTATTKKELYGDIVFDLNALITALTAVYTAINNAYTALP